jgi:hypothetical protein
MLLATRAVDDIDSSCKFHDVCYEVLGHNDPFCDFGLVGLLNDTDPNNTNYTVVISTQPNQQLSSHFDGGCGYLAFEIATGINTYMAVKQKGSALDRVAELASGAETVGISPLLLAELEIRRGQAGPIPDGPGTCFFSSRVNKRQLILTAYDRLISGYVYKNCPNGSPLATSETMTNAIMNAIAPKGNERLIAGSASLARGMSVPKQGYYPSADCVKQSAAAFQATMPPATVAAFWAK